MKNDLNETELNDLNSVLRDALQHARERYGRLNVYWLRIEMIHEKLQGKQREKMLPDQRSVHEQLMDLVHYARGQKMYDGEDWIRSRMDWGGHGGGSEEELPVDAEEVNSGSDAESTEH